MEDVNVAALQTTVVWLAFAIAFVVGAVMNRTNYCAMGAISDVVNMGDWDRMRMWSLAIGVAMIGTGALSAAGLIDPAKTIYTGSNLMWLSNLLGGLLFGFGMVLASGCGSKTLVRIGGGSLKAVIVFVTLGIFAYMTLRGLTAIWRVATVDTVALAVEPGQDLPRMIAGADGGTLATTRLVLGLLVGLAFAAFALKSREFRRFDNLLGGVIVGLGVVALWYVSGNIGYLQEHPDTLEEAFLATNTQRMESLTFVAPIAFTLELLMYWSDASRVVTIGIASALGVIAGSCAYALATRRFRWEGLQGAEDTANHLIGGALMGVGGITAMGCTVGQGVTGVSTLAIGSFIALIGIVAGGIIALKYQIWRVERMA